MQFGGQGIIFKSINKAGFNVKLLNPWSSGCFQNSANHHPKICQMLNEGYRMFGRKRFFLPLLCSRAEFEPQLD